MKYQVIIKNHLGQNPMVITDITSLQAGRFDRSPMTCTIVIPQTFPISSFSRDMLIEIWRENDTGGMVLDGETCYFLRDFYFYRDASGIDLIELKGYDAIYILDGREVEYPAGSTQAEKTGLADDVIKEIVDENFDISAPGPTTRQISTDYMVIETDYGLGQTITKSFSRQYVLSTIQAICDQSRSLGTWLTFDMFYNGSYPIEFRTYVNQRGVDLTEKIVLSVEAGNLINPRLGYLSADEKTFVTVAGKGEEASRIKGTASNETAIAETIWGRREMITENFQMDTNAALESEANIELNKHKAKWILEAQIADTEGTRYGINWNYGDRVKAQYLGKVFECRILGYDINYSKIGDTVVDTITAVLRGEVDA